MASAKWFDRYQSTLSSAYTSGGTSLVVASAGSGASALPATGDFWVVVEADGANPEEVFKCTAVSGTTLTVTGAQAGTFASNHGSGAVIRGAVMTAAAITQLKADAGGGGSAVSMTLAAFNTETSTGTANPSSRNLVYLTDSVYTVLWNGTAWEYYCGSLLCYPLSSTELTTWVNQGTATFTTTAPCAYIEGPNGGNARNLRGLFRSLPATPFTLSACVRMFLFGGNQDSTAGGLVLRESATGKMVTLQIGAAGALDSQTYSSATSSGGIASQSRTMQNGGIEWLRIADNGTNRILSYSHDGRQWVQFDSRTRASNFTTAPDQLGIYVDPNHGFAGLCGMQVLSWKIT